MAEIMEMLALSPTMEEGVLAEWLKSEGEAVDEGEVLAEVETDKATMEMESFYSGTVLKVLAEAGSTVKVGDPLVIIGEEGEDISDILDGLGGGGAETSSKSSDQEGSASRADENDDADDEEASGDAEASDKSDQTDEAKDSDGKRLKASPLARRIAEDKGLKLANISGSGPGGRIIKRDVEGAEAADAASADESAAAAKVSLEGGDLSFVPGEKTRLSQMRKTIAKRLVQVWQSTPHFYLTRTVDMGPLMARRKEINQQLADAEAGIKISVNDFIVKASAAALAQYPAMNVAFAGDAIYEFDEVNVGVAVAVDEGLITPTVKDADKKSVGAISREIRELAGRAKEGKLAPEEYSAHTFSVSNLGMYEIDEFLAVINAPDSAILACGAVKDVPVVENGELAVGTRMKISLACDHRAVDGAVGAEFMQVLVRYLESPMTLLV